MKRDVEKGALLEAAPLLPSVVHCGDTAPGHEWSVDEALCHIGRGRFQFLLFLVLGFTYMTDAGEMLLLSFVGPDVECAWGLNSTEQSLLITVVFVGMAAGAFSFGSMSDVIGRKPTVLLDVGICTLGGYLSAIAPSFYWLLFFRFVVGMGLGGFVLLLSMFSEFLPIEQRGRSLAAFQLFWGIGACLEILLAWMVFPHWHWRGLVLAMAVPLSMLLLIIPFIPESPRYLVVHGRVEEAKNVLHYIARLNGVTLPVNFQLKSISVAPSVKQWSAWTLWDQFKSVFEPPLNRITPAVWSTWVVAALGYYSVVVLTTSIQADDSENDSCVGDHVHFSNKDFRDIFIDATAEIPGTLFVYFTVDYFGRKKIWICSLLGGAASLLLLPMTSALYTVFLFGARFFATAVFVVTLIYAPEIYPSSCRAFAMGLGNVLSRVGGSVSPFVAQSMYDSCGLTAVAIFEGLILLAVSVMAMLVPIETGGNAMQDSLEGLRNDLATTEALHTKTEP